MAMSPRSLTPAGSESSSSASQSSYGIVAAIDTGPTTPKTKPPQDIVDDFWAKFSTKHPGKATTVIPKYKHARIKAVARSTAREKGVTAQSSYEEAAALCRDKVDKIVKECRRVNKKYRDLHFDLEWDLKCGRRECLQSLQNDPDESPGSDFEPQSVKRVPDIFDRPQFFVDGPSAHDVRQGRDGDCWLMAALCTLSNKPGLIERICVAQDQAVGVYGFVFHRDGGWISEIIDDQLYLTKPDYDESHHERILWEDRDRVNSEEAYRRTYQTNSGSLYFAQSSNPNETWLPLLEKCYAKAHGDFAAIEGGFCGEGIEDLTGGVTSELYAADILDKEKFWGDLLQVNQEFLFGCSTGVWHYGRQWGERKGIVEKHAYSVMRTVDMDGKRLVMLRNPWGKGEWTGAWSDGSKEWSAEWMQKLNHKFGDDGTFWISFEDLLRKYQVFERTRLFGPEWRITSEWTTLNVPWTLEYHDTYFTLSLAQSGPVVIVLSQLDDRYFRGLEGQYSFRLAFRVHKRGEESYIVRTEAPLRMSRSVNVDLELEKGEYDVRVKVQANRNQDILPVEDVIRLNAKPRRDKLMRVGLAYDFAHSKGKIIETRDEKKAREAYEKRKKDKKRAELRAVYLKEREKRYYLRVKDNKQQQRQHAKEKAKRKAREERARAKRPKQDTSPDTDAPGSQPDDQTHDGPGAEAEETPENVEPKDAPNSTEAGTPTFTKQVQILTPEESALLPEADLPTEADAPVQQDQHDGSERLEVSEQGVKDTPMTAHSWSTPAATPQTPFTPATDLMSPQPEKEEASAALGGSTLESEDNGVEGAVPPQQATDEEASQKGLGLINVPVDVVQETDNPTPDAPPQQEAPDQDTSAEGAVSIPGDVEHPEPEADDTEDDDGIESLSDLSELSERELDIYATEGMVDDDEPSEQPGTPEDEFEKDPWNAVVVVGLRVYYKTAEAGEDVIKLSVVRPSAYEDYEEKVTPSDGSKGLDVDDSSKDATVGVKGPERRKTIVPDS